MRCSILFFLFITILKATSVHINDVHDAHVNVQMVHDTSQQSRISMHGGQTSAESHQAVQEANHGKVPEQSGESNKEKTKGTLNYHRTKKLHHRIAKEGFSDELNASIHGPNAELHDPQHPRIQFLQSKILEHNDGFAKHKGLIRELKDGKKVPGKKNMQRLRDKDKMPPGYH